MYVAVTDHQYIMKCVRQCSEEIINLFVCADMEIPDHHRNPSRAELSLNFFEERDYRIIRVLNRKNNLEFRIFLQTRASQIISLIFLKAAKRLQDRDRRPLGKRISWSGLRPGAKTKDSDQTQNYVD